METGDAFLAEKKWQGSRRSNGDCRRRGLEQHAHPFLLLASCSANHHLFGRSGDTPRNLPAGAIFTHYLPEKMAGQKLTVKSPDGSAYVVKAVKRGTQAVAEFSQTREPGTYEISAEGIDKVKFVAQPSTKESLLERMSKEEILSAGSELAESVDYIDASGDGALAKYLELDANRTFGREMWKYLLIAVLSLIFLEIILQRVFGRVKS